MVVYPWGGDFVLGNPESCVAVVTLAEGVELPKDKVAVYGNMKTENLGIEKVVANVIANPNIRFLIVVGEDIRGHKSGGTLVALHQNGIDENNRVTGAPGAVPYIENLDREALTRFQEQIELVDMIGNNAVNDVIRMIDQCTTRNPGSFGEAYVAIKLEESGKRKGISMSGSISLYADFTVDYTGKINALEEGG
jgi:tetrahydromethanopterin S-methyltransferase subunit A